MQTPTDQHQLDDPTVELPLSEIQRIRDALMRLPERATSNLVRHLFSQVAGLYQRLAANAKHTTPQ